MATNITTPKQTKQQLKTSNYIAIVIIVSVLVVLGSGYFIKSLSSGLILNQKIIAKKSVASNTLKTDISAAKSITQQYSDLGSQVKTIESALPGTADFSGIANAVEAMAGASGMQYKDVAAASNIATSAVGTTSSKGAATLGTQGITITVSGSYAALNRFLSALESSARPVRVNDISISGTSAVLNATIDATTYYQSPTTFTVTSEDVK
jgi:Tfp pilus assembly protein PilO